MPGNKGRVSDVNHVSCAALFPKSLPFYCSVLGVPPPKKTSLSTSLPGPKSIMQTTHYPFPVWWEPWISQQQVTISWVQNSNGTMPDCYGTKQQEQLAQSMGSEKVAEYKLRPKEWVGVSRQRVEGGLSHWGWCHRAPVSKSSFFMMRFLPPVLTLLPWWAGFNHRETSRWISVFLSLPWGAAWKYPGWALPEIPS